MLQQKLTVGSSFVLVQRVAILYKLKLGEIVTTIPTIGEQCRSVTTHGYNTGAFPWATTALTHLFSRRHARL